MFEYRDVVPTEKCYAMEQGDATATACGYIGKETITYFPNSNECKLNFNGFDKKTMTKDFADALCGIINFVIENDIWLYKASKEQNIDIGVDKEYTIRIDTDKFAFFVSYYSNKNYCKTYIYGYVLSAVNKRIGREMLYRSILCV